MNKTNAERRNRAWFALADAEHCRLLCYRLTTQGTQHVDEYGAFDNTLPEAEHARPMTGDGMTHDIEEEERRFGAQIVDWLRRKAEEHKIDRLAIFAPPRMLGVLRKASSGLLTGHLQELEGNLMRLDAGYSRLTKWLNSTSHTVDSWRTNWKWNKRASSPLRLRAPYSHLDSRGAPATHSGLSHLSPARSRTACRRTRFALRTQRSPSCTMGDPQECSPARRSSATACLSRPGAENTSARSSVRR